MAGVAQPTPLALLLDIEHRARKHTGGPTLREQVLDEWVGIEFRLGTLRLAAPLEEVLEILKFPELTKVPRTKPWVRGIANVRGNLLPVMDLQGFLAGRLTAINRDSRVLVISHKVIFAGLLVDQVMGIKRFPKESQIQALHA
jgi:Chemotaxis signal transduction protein